MINRKNKIKATIVVEAPLLLNNNIFSPDPSIISDHANAPFVELKKSLMLRGIDLATEDIHPRENSQIIIEQCVPSIKYKKKPGQLHYLIIIEPVVVSKNNWLTKNHYGYDKIFV